MTSKVKKVDVDIDVLSSPVDPTTSVDEEHVPSGHLKMTAEVIPTEVNFAASIESPLKDSVDVFGILKAVRAELAYFSPARYVRGDIDFTKQVAQLDQIIALCD